MTALLVAITFAWDAPKADHRNSLEMAIKAAFLSKFQLYVTWPDRAYASSSSPFNLCIVGDDVFAALVERAASGQSVADHAITVLRLRSPSAADLCKIMYVATDDPHLAHQQLAAVDGLPVLTVTDELRLESGKGVINFVIAADRVRFEIDNAMAVRNGLTISSKLLSLAVAVKPAP
jgi:hypothetical protein